MVKGAEPVFEQAHVFFPELNPILSLLNFHQATVAGFISNASADLNSTPGGERVQSQIAIIDPITSLTKYTKRPKWERGNAYLEPNALRRAPGFRQCSSRFDCKPEGGTLRDPVDSSRRRPDDQQDRTSARRASWPRRPCTAARSSTSSARATRPTSPHRRVPTGTGPPDAVDVRPSVAAARLTGGVPSGRQ